MESLYHLVSRWYRKECPNVTVPTIYIFSPLRDIVHAPHAWKCTKDAQIEDTICLTMLEQLPLTVGIKGRYYFSFILTNAYDWINFRDGDMYCLHRRYRYWLK